MKKLYGFIGLTGFILIIGAAGGAENTSFGITVFLMLAGLAMLAASQLLIKVYEIKLRRRRLLAKRCGSTAKRRALPVNANIAVRTRKINSLELC